MKYYKIKFLGEARIEAETAQEAEEIAMENASEYVELETKEE